ncbi:lytic transglycosylase domain-containing protein [Maritalea porphyrae]|uniref:lytic transglycosylase domain-containing protein n=1 Tax=Maritalea porphyrae TaxID=880732 RepID=UPI0022B00323|nr:lytic transglycosylase domain-containing protein [Maritalea porphyrae]MCZ4270856.1 lytic transglycosylase domain-containing protein [Maritalea porphyrae]
MPRQVPTFSKSFLRAFAALTCAVSLSQHTPAFAQQQIDNTVTSSIGNTSQTTSKKGSQRFQNALAALSKGDFVEAYGAARSIDNDVERRAIQWAAIFFGNGKVDHDTVLRFQEDAPHFATAKTYKIRMEQALTSSPADSKTTIALLGGSMPNTLDAQIALADAYVQDGQVERAGRIIKSVWVNNFLTREVEDDLKARYGRLLTRDDHWSRALRLLMHDRASGAERIMDQLTSAQRSLVVARVAVSRKQQNAASLLDRVDPSLRNHPLFYFANAQRLRQNGAISAAVAELNKATGTLPQAQLWWYERRLLTRQLLAVGKPETAYLASAGYTNGPEGRLVDASFHAGWIALEFLGQADVAVKHFKKMASMSTLATSASKSHYWLGRAYAKLGDQGQSTAHFQQAAMFNQYYYGQLAMVRLGKETVSLRSMPSWQQSEAAFNQREIVRAIRLFEANKAFEFARPLTTRLIYQVKDAGEMLLTARLAQDIDAHDLAIQMSDVANSRGVGLDLFAFPKDGLPRHKLADVDNAAIYAIARQESKFNRTAISHAGARGLMQLMPGTAKETAGKLGLSYSPSKLTSDPAYNALLGSTYLKAQLKRYDGSLVLAAAAYNGGAGNVNKWLKAYGDPRSANVDPVVWIELIPFTETRGYVQKVLANYQIYKLRLGDNRLQMAKFLRTID